MASGEDEARRDLLWRVDLVAGLDRVALARLVAHIEPQPIEAGAVVCEQGDPSEALYIIVRGRFGVFVRADAGTERRISSLGPGDYFGEISMIDGKPRSATVTSVEPMKVLAVPHQGFQMVIDDDPGFARHLLKTLCARLREAEARPAG